MYGLLIALSIFISLYIAEGLVRRKGLDQEILWQAGFWSVLAGIIGARLYHVVDFWEVYSRNITSVFEVWRGGMGIYGALLGGAIGLVAFLRTKNERFWPWLDVIAFPLPLAQAIGRFGNYFNNEILPYALYEAGADLLLFFGLTYIIKKTKRPGTIFLLYASGYSLIRYLLEPIKTDPWTISGYNVAQTISLAIFLAATGTLLKWQQEIK